MSLFRRNIMMARKAPIPITYLTNWKIAGNSEVHGQEIWSCGEYNATDSKYHILVQPLGGSVADIALDAPLRMVNNVADNIIFTNGVTTVTRHFKSVDMDDLNFSAASMATGYYRMQSKVVDDIKAVETRVVPNILCPLYTTKSSYDVFYDKNMGIAINSSNRIYVFDPEYNTSSATDFVNHVRGIELLYELDTPTTETIDAPQIQEADSYICVISQGAKAIEWSSFETE